MTAASISSSRRPSISPIQAWELLHPATLVGCDLRRHLALVLALVLALALAATVLETAGNLAFLLLPCSSGSVSPQSQFRGLQSVPRATLSFAATQVSPEGPTITTRLARRCGGVPCPRRFPRRDCSRPVKLVFRRA